MLLANMERHGIYSIKTRNYFQKPKIIVFPSWISLHRLLHNKHHADRSINLLLECTRRFVVKVWAEKYALYRSSYSWHLQRSCFNLPTATDARTFWTDERQENSDNSLHYQRLQGLKLLKQFSVERSDLWIFTFRYLKAMMARGLKGIGFTGQVNVEIVLKLFRSKKTWLRKEDKCSMRTMMKFSRWVSIKCLKSFSILFHLVRCPNALPILAEKCRLEEDNFAQM